MLPFPNRSGILRRGSLGWGMIARLSKTKNLIAPVFDVSEMRDESDVEQKLVYPFLTNASYLGIPTA